VDHPNDVMIFAYENMQILYGKGPAARAPLE
jgi:hypothetical protein